MEKKDIDWGSLGFAYMHTDYSYVSNYKDGAWDEGTLTPDHTVTLSECAGLLHYCQEVFEGLKAYTTKSGDIVCFRPDQNAERMYNSAQRICMPPFPKDRFVKAVEEVVKANAAYVPPFGSGATLYIRPFMFATGDVIGVKPATEYQFRILVTPVGPYYKGGVHPVKLQVSKFDRAAPHGTGNIKAGLNYAMSLYPSVEAHSKGYADNMFLDPKTRTYVEESGGANILFVKEDGTLLLNKKVVPGMDCADIQNECVITRSGELYGIYPVGREIGLVKIADDFKEFSYTADAFYINQNGITFSKRVLEDLNYPQNVQYGFDPAQHVFAIKVCKSNEARATSFSKPRAEQTTTLSCGNKNLKEVVVKMIPDYDPKKRYKVTGEFDTENRVMYFDMTTAEVSLFRASDK